MLGTENAIGKSCPCDSLGNNTFEALLRYRRESASNSCLMMMMMMILIYVRETSRRV